MELEWELIIDIEDKELFNVWFSPSSSWSSVVVANPLVVVLAVVLLLLIKLKLLLLMEMLRTGVLVVDDDNP